MKAAVITALVVIVIAAAGALAYVTYTYGPATGPIGSKVATSVKLFSYGYGIGSELTDVQRSHLYRLSCTRKCHSSGVVEDTPRTAREWELIVTRMRDRAGLSERSAKAVSEHLQENYLSTVPTMLSRELMGYLKTHLWRFEFGDEDLYFDVIYMPEEHALLMPYLGITETPTEPGAVFIVLINTHQSVIPQWQLADMATMILNGGKGVKAKRWDVTYEDTQHHHREGMLIFPELEATGGEQMTFEITIKLPGIRAKTFEWKLPIPPYEGVYETAI